MLKWQVRLTLSLQPVCKVALAPSELIPVVVRCPDHIPCASYSSDRRPGEEERTLEKSLFSYEPSTHSKRIPPGKPTTEAQLALLDAAPKLGALPGGCLSWWPGLRTLPFLLSLTTFNCFLSHPLLAIVTSG